MLSFYREEEKNIKNNLKKLRSENWETQNDNIILKNLNSKNKFNFIYKNFAFSVYISVHEHIINILHEYQFNKELWEVETKIKFSDVNYDNIILKIFINKELISKLVTNEINSYGFRSYINYLYNENRKINYNIDSSFYKDKSFVNLVNKIEQPEFKIKLFDYQLRNLYSMIHMEKGHKFKKN